MNPRMIGGMSRGRPMAVLPDVISGARVIRDLGMVTRGKALRRCCVLECPVCQSRRDVQVADAKFGHVVCRTCATLKNTAHGFYGTRVYRCWASMLTRCRNHKATGYSYYGAQGIRVCDEWRDAGEFVRWALGHGYRDDLTLDRINGSGDYEPGNCRWVTMTVQARNTRKLSRRNTSGYRGVSRLNGRWGSQIRVDGIKIHLGSFDHPRDAAYEYDAFVIAEGMEHTLNFPRGAS